MPDDRQPADFAREMADVGPVSSLIPAVARAHRALAASLLRRVGLFPGQELLLMLLWERDGQSQGALARALDVEPPTAAKTLTRLEGAGFVRRAPSPDDGRVVLAWLTDAGRALRPEVERIWAELEAGTIARLTPAEQRELVALLRKVAGGVAGARDESAAAGQSPPP